MSSLPFTPESMLVASRRNLTLFRGLLEVPALRVNVSQDHRSRRFLKCANFNHFRIVGLLRLKVIRNHSPLLKVPL